MWRRRSSARTAYPRSLPENRTAILNSSVATPCRLWRKPDWRTRSMVGSIHPGSSPVQSLLICVNMACVLFGLTPDEALFGATRNAARALGLQDRKGAVAPGFDADLSVWDCADGIDLIYAIGANPCIATIKSG